MKQKIILMVTLLGLMMGQLNAQELKQIIRGNVIDKDSQMPVVGATIVIVDADPLVGTTTNVEGEFVFEPQHVGRYDFRVQCMGYEPRIVSNILVRVGKETILTIHLTESVIELKEVTISAKKHKGEPLSKMALISARSFTVEETNRYAGSFDDPAHMAANFAGVMGSPDGGNDIIVRGNSPRGMLWRMEGIEIPNPNHFADEGSSGGGISALNSKMLDNSDFYTGAFPAEYGNAYSGVFDLRLRNGNKHKREYSFSFGIIGIDFTAEGPFKKGGDASYLVNYRYSALDLLDAIGIKVAGDAVPRFQNISFKVNAPTKKSGIFTVFGLGGLSGIKEHKDEFKLDFDTDLAMMGISHTLPLDNKTILRTVLSFSGSRNTGQDRDSTAQDYYRLEWKEKITYSDLSISTYLNRKFTPKHSLKTGLTFTKKYYNIFGEEWNFDGDYLEKILDRKGNTEVLQAYLSWKYRFAKNVTLVSGLHYTKLFLNNNEAIEPRAQLSWEFAKSHKLSLGFGMHSKIESMSNYLAQQKDGFNNITYPNENLGFSRAYHYVVGYEHSFSKNLLMRLEAYYQDLYDVPVEDDPSSSVSLLNRDDGYTNDKFVNEGTGKNYGFDFTLEKFFSQNYYFLVTASVFDSKYKAKDGVERNTLYNTDYLFTALGGKEWQLKNNGVESTLAVSSKVIWNGGNRYTPIDVETSRAKGTTEYFENLAFSKQRDNFFRCDLKLQYRKNKKKTTHVWELDIQNVTNQQSIIWEYWDEDDQKVESIKQLGLLPVISYRIEF